MEILLIIALAAVLAAVVILGVMNLKRHNGDEMKDHVLLEERSQQLLQAERQRDEMQARVLDLSREVAALQQEVSNKEELLANKETELREKMAQMTDIQGSMLSQFKELAAQIVEEKAKHFDDHSSLALAPLKEELKRLEGVVNDTYQKGIKDQTDLRAELRNLAALNSNLQSEASRLTTALKGDSKAQGCYGEMLLERVLEMSGLEKGMAYKTQESFPLGEGRSLQPDAVVYMTDRRQIVVDSKMSLTDYERYVAAITDEDRERAIKAHVDSMKRHVQELSDKDYAHRLGLATPEYVMMFVPIESSFGAALRQEPQLYDFAWQRRVVIVTPSTLLATLAAVSQMWRQDKQTKNALEIARRAGALYDKVYGLVKDVENVSKSIDEAQRHLASVGGKLSEGRGNVIKQLEDLKEMGAKASKSLGDTRLGKSALEEEG